MTNRMSMRVKLVFTFLCIGLLSILIPGIGVFYKSEESLEKTARNLLQFTREEKKQQIENYFSTIRNQVLTLAKDLMIIDAMKEFSSAFKNYNRTAKIKDNAMSSIKMEVRKYYETEFFPRLLKYGANFGVVEQYLSNLSDTTMALQYYYTVANQNPIGHKNNLPMATDGSLYSQLHSKYHPILNQFLQQFSYYDIFLIDENGDLVYTVFKEVDFGTNLLTGPYKETNLSHAFRAAHISSDKDFSLLVDFASYEPSYGAPASFISAPIFDGTKKIGVLAFQMPIDKINAIMTSNQQWERVGLGKTGESYLVGQDRTMRTTSRPLIENPSDFFKTLDSKGINKSLIDQMKLLSTTILLLEINTEATREANRGRAGILDVNNYRDIPVLSAFSPVNIKDVNWAIISEIDKSEAFSPVYDLIIVGLAIGGGLLVVLVLLSFLLIKFITRPIHNAINKIAMLIQQKPINLKHRLSSDATEESAQLSNCYNKLFEELQSDIDTISKVAESLSDILKRFTLPLSGLEHLYAAINQEIIGILSQLEKNRDSLTDALENNNSILAFRNVKYSSIELVQKVSILQDYLQQLKSFNNELKIPMEKAVNELNRITKKYLW